MKRYSIRKMGTRRGQPHYGVDCMICPWTPGGRGKILSMAYLSREGAILLVIEHFRDVHGIEVNPK